MSSDTIALAADQLRTVYDTGVPGPPLIEMFPELTLEDAYDVQLAQVARWQESGRRVAGFKVGLTSVVMQRQLGVDQPDYGHLFSDMILPEHSPIDTGRFLAPRIEPEIAFVLGGPLRGPGATPADVLSAVAFVVPALEIIDSRVADWRISIIDTVADNASSAAVVLGSVRTPLDGRDLRLVGCNLRRNGELVATGAGGAVLGSPLLALTWLVNQLELELEPGAIVLPGSCTAAIRVVAGDAVRADFTGLGSVTARFAGAYESGGV